jgi:hypothetical protein
MTLVKPSRVLIGVQNPQVEAGDGSTTAVLNNLAQQRRADALSLQGGLDVQVVEQRSPLRMVVRVSTAETDQFAADFRDGHLLMWMWVLQPLRPDVHPVGEDITAKEGVTELTPVGAAPTHCMKVCDPRSVPWSGWSEFDHASSLRQQPGERMGTRDRHVVHVLEMSHFPEG